jgi:hypothetical protein
MGKYSTAQRIGLREFGINRDIVSVYCFRILFPYIVSVYCFRILFPYIVPLY